MHPHENRGAPIARGALGHTARDGRASSQRLGAVASEFFYVLPNRAAWRLAANQRVSAQCSSRKMEHALGRLINQGTRRTRVELVRGVPSTARNITMTRLAVVFAYPGLFSPQQAGWRACVYFCSRGAVVSWVMSSDHGAGPVCRDQSEPRLIPVETPGRQCSHRLISAGDVVYRCVPFRRA